MSGSGTAFGAHAPDQIAMAPGLWCLQGGRGRVTMEGCEALRRICHPRVRWQTKCERWEKKTSSCVKIFSTPPVGFEWLRGFLMDEAHNALTWTLTNSCPLGRLLGCQVCFGIVVVWVVGHGGRFRPGCVPTLRSSWPVDPTMANDSQLPPFSNTG